MSRVTRHRLGSTATRISRLVLGAALLLSILSANIPSALVASSPMCNLACCAGRAPHAAGSCMNGSCHANLLAHGHGSHMHHQSPALKTEQLCGLPKLVARASSLSLRLAAIDHSVSGISPERSTETKTAQKAPVGPSLSALSVGKPCQSDCGAGTLSSSNQRRPRESATHSFANRVRPPSKPGSLVAANNFIYARDAIRWQANPRAPPAPRF